MTVEQVVAANPTADLATKFATTGSAPDAPATQRFLTARIRARAAVIRAPPHLLVGREQGIRFGTVVQADAGEGKDAGSVVGTSAPLPLRPCPEYDRRSRAKFPYLNIPGTKECQRTPLRGRAMALLLVAAGAGAAGPAFA